MVEGTWREKEWRRLGSRGQMRRMWRRREMGRCWWRRRRRGRRRWWKRRSRSWWRLCLRLAGLT